MNIRRTRGKRVSLAVSIVILLVLLSCIFINSLQRDNAKAAVISNADIIETDLLLDKNYRGKKSGDYVFNLKALNELYDKLLGKENATFSEIDTAANVAKSGYTPNTSTTDVSNAVVKSIHSGMDSQDIRDNNNNRNIIVKIDSKEWIVTTLTTADNGHVILTLLLKDVAYDGKWGAWVPSSVDFSSKYPATVYSSSYIRAGLLNGAEQYTADGSTLTSLSDTEKEKLYGADGYPFGIYTDNKEQGHITNFIVAPNQVEYQQNENLYDVAEGKHGSSVWYNAPNDSSLNEIPTNKWSKSGVIVLQSKDGYFDWGNDKLWLPSISEMGMGEDKNVKKDGGLWGLDDQQRGCSINKLFWLRSVGFGNSATLAFYLDASGLHNTALTTDYASGATSAGVAGGTLAIRPAFNLDLTAANSSAFIPMTIPTDVSSTYDGTEQDCFDADGASKWYKETLFSSANANVKAEYFAADGSTLSTAKPIESGEYKVKLTVQNSSKYVWANCKAETEITFNINQKQLGVDFDVSTTPPTATPTDLCARDSALADTLLRIKYTTNAGYSGYTPPPGIDVYKAEVEIDTSVSNNYVLDDTYNIKYIAVPTLTTSTWYTYNGNERAYDISYGHTSDEVEIEISVPSEYNGLVTYSNNEIRVKNAGKYKVAVNIKKKDGTVNWSSRDRDEKYIEFEIKQSPFELDILSGGSNNVEITEGEKATVEIDSMVDVFAGDVLNFDVYATKNGTTTERLVYSGLTIDENTNFPLSIDLDTEGLSAASYTLELEKIGSGNSNEDYDITIGNAPITLIVNEIGVSSNIRWTFRRDGRDIDSFNQSTSILNATYGGKIEYNGSAVSISVRAGKLTLDTTYGTNGYITTPSTNNSAPMTNADTYTTSVRLLDENNKAEIYTLTWTIDKAKFDLSNVQWKSNGRLEYNGQTQEMVLENLPNKLIATYGGDDTYRDVTTSALHVTVDYLDFVDPDDNENYILPDINDPTTYKGNVVWETDWSIVPKEIKVQWGKELLKDKNNSPFNIPILRNKADNSVVVHTYYKTDANGNKIGGAISESDIVVPETGAEHYICELSLSNSNGYVLVGETTRRFEVFNQGTAVKFDPNKQTFAYTGKDVTLRFTNNSNLKSDQYEIKYYDVNGKELTSMPKEVGKYKVKIELKPELSGYFIGGDDEWEIEIVARVIAESWNTTSKPPRLNINKTELGMIEYEFADSDGNIISYEQMKSAAGEYKVRAKIKSEYANNCSFTSGSETGWQSFKLEDKDLANMQDPNDPTLYPDDPDMQEPENPDNNNPSGDIGSGNEPGGDGGALDELLKKLKEMPLWQLIASFVSIILIIIFMSKGIGYASKAKQSKKLAESKFKEYYAGTFLGLAFGGWTAIACVLMGLAVLSLVFMILEKNRYNKAIFAYEEAKDDFERHRETNRREYDDNRREEEYRRREEDDRRRDEEYRRREEDMKAMLMRMMGGYDFNNMGQPQGAYMGAQQGIGAEEIRGIVSETVTALLPGMQQALPQQASVNDELVQKLIEKEEQNDKTINKLIEQNQELMQKNDKLMQQLMNKSAEKEIVAVNTNDETIKALIEGQKAIMQRLAEQPTQQAVTSQPQIIEKIVEKPVEKIVEKEVRVEVPVETIVEKVVEKPIVISTEAVGEAEKSKQVKKTPAPKKAPAPRLTLEEAYAKLTKEQKKYFDGLREYAMSKDSKCKEKLSTYFTTIGPSTTNPFIKLTIKKGITVALFKMEDEYLKDIRRNASGDGTKVKVKETEVPIGDKQAYDTAKDMVDLRIDQIDRYNDYLKEQRALRK